MKDPNSRNGSNLLHDSNVSHDSNDSHDPNDMAPALRDIVFSYKLICLYIYILICFYINYQTYEGKFYGWVPMPQGPKGQLTVGAAPRPCGEQWWVT